MWWGLFYRTHFFCQTTPEKFPGSSLCKLEEGALKINIGHISGMWWLFLPNVSIFQMSW